MPEGPPYDQSAAAPFDPKKAIAELVTGSANMPKKKLAFHEQCSAFYALYNGSEHKIVADAFGVSLATISKLAGCLRADPRPTALEFKWDRKTQTTYMHEHNRDMNKNRNPSRIWRYRSVAEEFERLGEEAFAQQYYTNEIHTRIMRVKHNVDNEATRRIRAGSDPNASSHAGPFTDPGGYACEIIWADNLPDAAPGWYIKGPHVIMGREISEAGDRRPFKTSKLAFETANPR